MLTRIIIFCSPAYKFCIVIALVIMCSPLFAKDKKIWHSKDYSYKALTMADNLNQPWSMVFVNDNRILIAEKSGVLSLITLSSGTKKTVVKAQKIKFLPEVAVRGQGGLMDLTLSPDFTTTQLIYYSYTAKEEGHYGTHLGRFQFKDDKVLNKEVIFRAQNLARGGRHFGSRIVFDNEGYLYLSLGDRGDDGQAQNLNNHMGTVVRLDKDGKAAKDNPFIDKQGALAEIYSYGHRNPQGFIFAKDKLWLHEHGARGGDELNILKKGANYGWPIISYGKHYSGTKIGEGTHKQGMEQPLIYWDPSIAPSGMIIYTGDIFSKWQGDIFIGALAQTHLRRIKLSAAKPIKQERLLDGIGRVREVAQDKTGYIYILTDSTNGKLFRLEPVTD